MSIYTAKVKFCHKKDDIPKEPHFVILVFRSVYIPGDGPDYPSTSEDIIEYIVFYNEHEWKDDIRERTLKNEKNFTAIRATPATIKTEVIVDVS